MSTGFPEQALLVSSDLDHKFELAVTLKKLDVAYAIAKESESDQKWKQLGELALACWNFAVCDKWNVRSQGGDDMLICAVMPELDSWLRSA